MEQHFTYGIKGIHIVEKHLYSNTNEDPTKKELEYNITSNPLLDRTGKLFFQVVKVDISLKGLEGIKGSLSIACAFSVQDFEEVFADKNEINAELEMALRMEAMSTLRGVMFSEFRGTFLNAAILPLIKLNEMVKTEPIENPLNG